MLFHLYYRAAIDPHTHKDTYAMNLMWVLLMALLPSIASQAAWSPGTKAYYKNIDNSLVDVTGNYANLVKNGTVANNTSPLPCIGLNSGGVFSNANYYNLPAALLTDLKTWTSAWSVELCFNLNSLANSPVPWADAGSWFIQVNTTGAIRWSSNGGILGPGTNDVSTGTSYKVLTTYDGTNKRVFFNDKTSPYLGPTAQSADPSTIGATFLIGKYSGATEAVDGYISSVRVFNVVATPGFTVNDTTTQKLVQNLKLNIVKGKKSK